MEENGGGGSSDDTRTCPRGHWRPAEDEKLRQLVERYGPQNWNSIAEKLQGRSGVVYVLWEYRLVFFVNSLYRSPKIRYSINSDGNYDRLIRMFET